MKGLTDRIIHNIAASGNSVLLDDPEVKLRRIDERAGRPDS